MSKTKIFLTGTARGGTQIVSKMLSANNNINVATGPLLEILRLQRNLILINQHLLPVLNHLELYHN